MIKAREVKVGQQFVDQNRNLLIRVLTPDLKEVTTSGEDGPEVVAAFNINMPQQYFWVKADEAVYI